MKLYYKIKNLYHNNLDKILIFNHHYFFYIICDFSVAGSMSPYRQFCWGWDGCVLAPMPVPGALYLAVVPDTAKLRRPWYKPRTAAFLPSDFTGLVFPAMECLAFGISEGKKWKLSFYTVPFQFILKKCRDKENSAF